MNLFSRAACVAASLLMTSIGFAADSYSIAEQRVFLDNHLESVKPGTTLTYTLQQTGKPDESFTDEAVVSIRAGEQGKKAVSVQFLSGPRKLSLPDIEDATSNPVVLYFLEKDVRDMHRQIGGQEAYFRKRIRLALADAATVKPVTATYAGKPVQASEISITPFVDDPLKERFAGQVKKRYTFVISDRIPGGVFEVTTETGDPAGNQTVSLKLKASS